MEQCLPIYLTRMVHHPTSIFRHVREADIARRFLFITIHQIHRMAHVVVARMFFFALSAVFVCVCLLHLKHRIFTKSQLVSDACSLVYLSSSGGSERFFRGCCCCHRHCHCFGGIYTCTHTHFILCC